MGIVEIDEARGIIYEKWEAPCAKAVLLLVHGLGGHTGRWQFLSEFFLRSNISSYAIELRGFGRTEGLKGHADNFGVYHKDILNLYKIAVRENPGKKIFLAGESMGGLICFLLACRNPELFSGLVCIAPAFKSIIRFPPLDYTKIFFSLIYNPGKQFNVAFTSQMCTRDPVYLKTMEFDPREHRFATSGLLFSILIAQIQSRLLKNKIKTPVLFLLAGKDQMIDSNESRKIFESLKVKEKAMIEYSDMLHALSIDLGREKVFEDILKWMQNIF